MTLEDVKEIIRLTKDPSEAAHVTSRDLALVLQSTRDFEGNRLVEVDDNDNRVLRFQTSFGGWWFKGWKLPADPVVTIDGYTLTDAQVSLVRVALEVFAIKQRKPYCENEPASGRAMREGYLEDYARLRPMLFPAGALTSPAFDKWRRENPNAGHPILPGGNPQRTEE